MIIALTVWVVCFALMLQTAAKNRDWGGLWGFLGLTVLAVLIYLRAPESTLVAAELVESQAECHAADPRDCP
jgi:hypothetical protein